MPAALIYPAALLWNMNREAVQEIFGKRARGYVDSASHADKRVLDEVRRLCGDLAGGTVLDVATGTGHVALHLAPDARRVVGLDLTRQMLELAGEEAARRCIANASWLRGDVRSLPFPSRSFRAVTCRRAAHHFPDLRGAISEMTRVLKDDGVLVIDDRSVPEDPDVDRTMNHLDLLHDRSHVREYGRREWEGILKEAGLSGIVCQEYRRHLPLSTMTWNAEEADAREIEHLVEALPPSLKKRMAVEVVDGTVFLDQYYITIRATK